MIMPVGVRFSAFSLARAQQCRGPL